MKPTTRLLIDCSHSFVANEKRGIDRVLSQILHHAGSFAPDRNLEVRAVAWLPDGQFHYVPMELTLKPAPSTFRRLLSAGWAAASQYLVPYAIVFYSRKGAKYFSERRLALKYARVQFRAGDVLLLADANWNLPTEYINALGPAKHAGAKLVLMMYDLIPLQFPQFVDVRLEKDFRRWLQGVMKVSDVALAISKTIQNDIEAYAREQGIRDFKSLVTYLGADYHQSQGGPIRSDLRGYFSLDRPYLAVGTLEPRKQPQLIFRAFQKLWAEGLDVRICFVGKVLPRAYPLLDEMRSSPQWGHQVRVFEGTSDDELAFCYANARALIAASAAEGFDLPTVEARGHRLPVLASDTTVHHEVGEKGVTYYRNGTPGPLVEVIKNAEADPSFFVQKEQLAWMSWQESVANILDSAVGKQRDDA